MKYLHDKMNRRLFLQSMAASMAALTLGNTMRTQAGENKTERIVMTVNGPVSPSALGIMLPHEHVVVDFIGADQVSPARYNADKVFDRSPPRCDLR